MALAEVPAVFVVVVDMLGTATLVQSLKMGGHWLNGGVLFLPLSWRQDKAGTTLVDVAL